MHDEQLLGHVLLVRCSLCRSVATVTVEEVELVDRGLIARIKGTRDSPV